VDILIRAGEMDAAAMACKCLLKLSPVDTDAYLDLSALECKRGNRKEARRILERGINANPVIVRTCESTPYARVLRVRGVQNGYYTLGKSRNGDYKVKLRGGNLTDRYLTDFGRFQSVGFYLLDGNILEHPEIPKFDIILNMISDPDVELTSLHSLTKFTQSRPHVPVINNPSQVALTSRDNNYQRFKDVEGVRYPKTIRFMAANAGIEDAVRAVEDSDFSFPLLVRETGTHTGRTFNRIDNSEDFAVYFSRQQSANLYITQYIDQPFRSEYFRKLRVFFVNGRIFPVVCHIDTVWNVHGGNRRDVMAKNGWMTDEERAFMNDCQAYLGKPQYEVLCGLYDEVDLDFFGVDFNVDENGHIVIFELNPAMRHSYDHADDFPYLAPHLHQITDAFNAMIDRKLGRD